MWIWNLGEEYRLAVWDKRAEENIIKLTGMKQQEAR
jgi:hypothetical protein